MAVPILHKSPPKESNKTGADPNSRICLNGSQHRLPAITETINALDGLPPLHKAANICSLPGPSDHFVNILEKTIANLTRLHEDLSKIEKMLVKGGER
jgi:hypothetical protein